MAIVLKTVFMLIAYLGCSAFEAIKFETYYSFLAGGFVLLLGVVLKSTLVAIGEHYNKVVQTGLFIYGVIYFCAKQSGVDTNILISIVSTACCGMFSINFWHFSDPLIQNTD
jgi:hypothetical protein